MNDAGKIIYTPLWLRALAIVVLSTALLISFYAILVFINQTDRETYVLTAMALAQISASGLVLLLIVFYSRREVGMKGIVSKNDLFLSKELPEALKKISRHHVFDWSVRKSISLKVDHVPGELLAFYELKVKHSVIRMSVSFNVRRMVVIYHFPSPESGDLDHLEQIFETVISGAKNAGYDFAIRVSNFGYTDGSQYNTLYFYCNNLPDDFLLDPLQKLYWVNDVSLMTRSVLIDTIKHAIPTDRASDLVS